MKMIKKHLRILRLAIFIGIGLAFALMRGHRIVQRIRFQHGPEAAALYRVQLATPTPTVVKAVSIPGSTDQIMLMGMIITVIVTLPVLFLRSTWTNK